jgi:hypothetical protein
MGFRIADLRLLLTFLFKFAALSRRQGHGTQV